MGEIGSEDEKIGRTYVPRKSTRKGLFTREELNIREEGIHDSSYNSGKVDPMQPDNEANPSYFRENSSYYANSHKTRSRGTYNGRNFSSHERRIEYNMSDQERSLIKDYIEDSQEEGPGRRSRGVFIDDGGIGEINRRFDNTRQLGPDSMERERKEILENRLDRELDEREFLQFKRDLQKSKNEYLMREHIMRQSRNRSR